MKFEYAMTDHGMPLYVCTLPHLSAVVSGIVVLAGTVDEAWPEEAGLAHAFEHMVFQGNEARKDCRLVSVEIEEVGGLLNAWTSHEATVFHNIVPTEFFARGVSSLAGLLRAPLFEEGNIATEMQVVLEEVKRSEDDPSEVSFQRAREIAFGAHPLGRNILGMRESVRRFTRGQFVGWHRRLYNPDNFSFLVIGNVTLSEALRTVNAISFGRRGEKHTRVRRPVSVSKSQNAFVRRDFKQANLCMVAVAGPAQNRSTAALNLYSYMVDGGMSFPLFQELRDKRGLCYSVGAGLDEGTEASLFLAHLGTKESSVDEAVKCIRNVLWESRADRELFVRAKALLLGRLSISANKVETLFMTAVKDILFYDAPRSFGDIRAEMESLTLEEVTQAVEDHIHPNRFSIACVLPLETTHAA